MSGGSYNYLCNAQDLEQLLGQQNDLEEMADRLKRLGWADDAARETLELVAKIHVLGREAERVMERLNGVWHAVEWWDSADWAEDRVKEALAEYRGERS